MPESSISWSQIQKSWKIITGTALVLIASGGVVQTIVTRNASNVTTRSEYSDGRSAQSGSLTVGSGGLKNILHNDGRVTFNNVTYRFPYTDGSASGKVLGTNSAGQLSWTTVAGGTGNFGTGNVLAISNALDNNTSTGALAQKFTGIFIGSSTGALKTAFGPQFVQSSTGHLKATFFPQLLTSSTGSLDTIFLKNTEADTETELESLLTDVTNVFTNNDGALADDNLSNNTTSDLAEGTNQYYTEERVDDRVDALILDGSNIVTTYSDVGNSLTITGIPFTSTGSLQALFNTLYFQSSTGSLRTAFDRRYVNTAGDTMTGQLIILSTTEQMRLGYDASNYAGFTVASDKTLTIGNGFPNQLKQFVVQYYDAGGYSGKGFKLSDVGNGSAIILHALTGTPNSLYLTDAAGDPAGFTIGTISNPYDSSTFANASGKWYFPTSNLGVGTSVPGSRLSVSGAVVINRTGTAGMTADAGLTLEIIGTASGRTLHAQDQLRSSGGLVIDGSSIILGHSDFTTCTALETIAGVLTCGTDAEGSGGGTFGTGNVITIISGTALTSSTGSLKTNFGLQFLHSSTGALAQKFTGIFLASSTGALAQGLKPVFLASSTGSLANSFKNIFIASSTGALKTAFFQQLLNSSTGSLSAFFRTMNDARYVNTSGDTMTGALNVRANLSGTSLTVSSLNAASCDMKSTNGVVSCGTDDDVPESGDFANGVDLEADGSLSVDVIADAEMADNDFGDWTCASGDCTLDADTVSTAEMADADHGDFTYSGGVATLDADVVAAAEMADADHGDISWSGGVASIDADTVGQSEVTGNALDFAEFQDALDVDAATTITLGTNDLDFIVSSTGELEIIGVGSGRVLHAQDSLRSSGSLLVEGASLLQGPIGFENYTSCNLDTSSTGALICGSDADTGGGGGAFTSSGSLETYFNRLYVNVFGDTMTGALVNKAPANANTIVQEWKTRDGRQRAKITGSGSLTLSGALTVLGAGNVTGLMTITDDLTVNGGNINFGGSTTIGDGGDAIIIDAAGTLTINDALIGFSQGTTIGDGGDALIINSSGTMTIQDILDISDNNMVNVGDVALDTISSDASTTIGITLGADAGDDLLIDTNTLVVEGDDNKVGILQTDPETALDVAGTISGALLTIMRGNSYILGNLAVGLTTPETAVDVKGTISGTTLTGMHGTSYMLGNVGIGTTSPNYKLGVAGDIQAQVDDTFIGADDANPPRFGFAKQIGNDPKMIHASNKYFILARSNQTHIDPTGATFTDEFIIKTDGVGYFVSNFGIGTSDAQSKLQVTGGGGCFGSDASCNTDNNTEGKVYATGTAMDMYDVAERYPTKDETLTGTILLALDLNNPVFVKTAKKGDKLIGIHSLFPAVDLGGFTTDKLQFKDERQVAVALVGRVPLYVTTENGEIKVGDDITISSIPGTGMKADQKDQSVGYALEPCKKNNPWWKPFAKSECSIQVFVHLSR